MRRVITVAIMCFFLGTGMAHWASALYQTHVKPARYRITENSPKWMPDKVLIRCEGWAEDTASRLILIRFGEGKPPVYRCLRGSEV